MRKIKWGDKIESCFVPNNRETRRKTKPQKAHWIAVKYMCSNCGSKNLTCDSYCLGCGYEMEDACGVEFVD